MTTRLTKQLLLAIVVMVTVIRLQISSNMAHIVVTPQYNLERELIICN